MRLALIADIHGNRPALDTVLAHIRQLDVDRTVCLGDVAALGPDPAGCVDLVNAHANLAVMGNTDAWMLRPDSEAVSGDPAISALAAWSRSRLSEEQLEQVARYSAVASVTLSPAVTLQVFHGTPGDPDGVIFAGMPDEELLAAIGTDSHASAILAGGHTHVQMLRRIDRRTVINPGSVGLPGVGPGMPGLTVNADVHWAEFAIVDSSAEGTSFEFLRTPLSVRQMLHEARKSGMPGYEWWASKWRSVR